MTNHNPISFFIAVAVVFCVTVAESAPARDLSVVERWLATNADTQSLHVEFTQSRSLRAIKSPLVQHGTLWMDYLTGQFRWQLGEPAKTIVVSHGEDQIAVMRTPLKRVEYRQIGKGSSAVPGMASLAVGFPKTLADFEKKYRILEIARKGAAYDIVTAPLDASSDGVHRFRFVVDAERFLLKGLVLDLKDGSSVTTTFQRVHRNAAINAAVFEPDLSGYRETTFRQG